MKSLLVGVWSLAALSVLAGQVKSDFHLNSDEDFVDYSAMPFVELGGTEYYFETNLNVDWFSANDFCRRAGLYLADVQNNDENVLIQNHIRSISTSGNFWTSLSDQGAWDSWVWGSTGKNPVFTDWGTNEPDHGQDMCTDDVSTTERAVAYMFSLDLKWGTLNPHLNISHFICKKQNDTVMVHENDLSDLALQDESYNSPSPFVTLGDTEYYFEPNLRANWFAASDFCRRLGFYLTAVESEEEHMLISTHLRSIGATYDFWTSGLQTMDSYVWSSTGFNMIYESWGSGQPTQTGSCNETESAIVFWKDGDFQWKDRSPYTFQAYIICEDIAKIIP